VCGVDEGFVTGEIGNKQWCEATAAAHAGCKRGSVSLFENWIRNFIKIRKLGEMVSLL
jgi:hypothetical protein